MIINKFDLINKFNSIKAATGKTNDGGSRTDYLIKDGYIIATNGEVVARTKIDTDENMVLPGKVVNLVKTLPDADVIITGNDENVKIVCNKVKNLYKTTAVDKYILPKVISANSKTTEIEANVLVKAINLVSYAIPKVNQRQILTGLNIKCENGYLNFVGLDGYRIAWCMIETAKGDCWNITVPKTCTEIVKNAELKDNVKITFNSSWITFEDANTSISSRLLDGEYLNYENIFSTDGYSSFKVVKPDLINCINRVKTVSNDRERTKVIMNLSDDMDITLNEDTVNYAEKISIDKNIDLKIAFNINYINDAVKNIDTDIIRVYANGTKSPFVFVNDDDNTYRALVLPVRLD